MEDKAKAKDSDEDSMSSYETGHEMFYDDEEEAPEVPAKEEGGSDVSQSTVEAKPHTVTANMQVNGAVSTGAEGTTAPVRRKSVRMSLQPTFSPTPPAIEDDEVTTEPWGHDSAGNNGHANGSAWEMRGGRDEGKDREKEKDVWEDSSDEDVEYRRARALLRKVGRKIHKA